MILTYQRETGMVVDVQQTCYWLCLFLYALDEIFHIYNQLTDDDFDAHSIVMWEMLNVAQQHCTEWCGGGKPKGCTLGDVYLCVNF